MDGEQNKDKEAFLEGGKGEISQSDRTWHFSTLIEDRTALQTLTPHQPVANSIGRILPKLNPSVPCIHMDGVAGNIGVRILSTVLFIYCKNRVIGFHLH